MWTPPSTVAVGDVGTAALWNAQVRDNMLALAPTGKLSYFMEAATAAENLLMGAWLELNGADVSRTTYPSLWALLGTTLAAAFNGTTTLGAAISSTTATAITIAAWPSGFPSTGWPSDGTKILIEVDSEKMLVTAGFGTTSLTVVRGVEGTTAATHSNGATVSAPSQSWFGDGDGSTTFTLPDMGGRGLIAAANGGHVDVSSIGGRDNTVKTYRRPRHRHTVVGSAITASGSAAGSGGFNAPSTWTGATVGADPTNDPKDSAPYGVLGIWAVKI